MGMIRVGVDAYHMYHMHANTFYIICMQKQCIICTPNMCVSYIRPKSIFVYKHHKFLYCVLFTRVFMRAGSVYIQLDTVLGLFHFEMSKSS